MKKLFLMLAVAGFFVACNTANSKNADEKSKQETTQQADEKKSDCDHAKADEKKSDCDHAKADEAKSHDQSDCGTKTAKTTEAKHDAADCGATAAVKKAAGCDTKTRKCG
jgi:uncharacterized protein involved in copper resistance